jgi:hypothetical protein
MIFIIFFAAMNYSIFFHPLNFLYGFATNIANYGVNDGTKLPAFFYYSVTMLLIPLGASGFLLGIYLCYIILRQKIFSSNLILLTSPIIFFLILTGDANLATVRNINAFLGIIFIAFGYSLAHLIFNKLRIFKIIGIFLLVLILFQSLYYVLQTSRDDARYMAAAWITHNIEIGETIGTNPACSYKFPAGNNYQLIYDPDMKNNYDYYLFDMYWANSKFYNIYSRNSWFFEFNPSYTMFYHSHNQLPINVLNFKGFNRDIKSLVPIGYEYKVITGFGPDVIILHKILK